MFFSFFPSSSSKGKVLKKRYHKYSVFVGLGHVHLPCQSQMKIPIVCSTSKIPYTYNAPHSFKHNHLTASRERRQPNPIQNTTSPNHPPSRELRPFHPPPASNSISQPQSSPRKRPRQSLISKILEARKKRIEEGHRAYAARDGPALAATTGKGVKRGNSTLVKNRHDGKGRPRPQQENVFIIPEIGHVSTFTDIVIAMPAEQVPGFSSASGDEITQDNLYGERHEQELTDNLAQLNTAHERGKRVNSDGVSSIGFDRVHFVPSGEWVAGWSGVSGADVGGSRASGRGMGRGYTSGYGGGVGYGGYGDSGGHYGADFGGNGGAGGERGR
jgi:hypothetical protein